MAKSKGGKGSKPKREAKKPKKKGGPKKGSGSAG